jgi:hypothetical protein
MQLNQGTTAVKQELCVRAFNEKSNRMHICENTNDEQVKK